MTSSVGNTIDMFVLIKYYMSFVKNKGRIVQTLSENVKPHDSITFSVNCETDERLTCFPVTSFLVIRAFTIPYEIHSGSENHIISKVYP